MWLDTGGSDLPTNVTEHLEQTLTREDRTDRVWVNLDTGSLLVLAAHGGWRTPEASYLKLYLYAAGMEPCDLTFAILGQTAVRFDPTKTASATYDSAFRTSCEDVTERIAAKRLWGCQAY